MSCHGDTLTVTQVPVSAFTECAAGFDKLYKHNHFSSCHNARLLTVSSAWSDAMLREVVFISLESRCSSTQFHCVNSYQCVPLCARCDGSYNCWDYSDEFNCSTYTSSYRVVQCCVMQTKQVWLQLVKTRDISNE
jgi:Low-density lipoprotein receptor domain class A